MTPDHLIPAIVIISLAGFAQGLSGFGFGLISMGLLPMWMDLNEAQAIATLTGLAGCVAMTGITVTHVRWANVGHLWIASTLGIPFGFWILKALPESVLLRILGLTICLLVVFEIVARRRSASEKSHWNVWLIGLTSGALSGAFNIGGPPLVVYLFSQSWSKEQQVATLSTVFISSGMMRMILLATTNDLTPSIWGLTAWSSLPMIAAIVLGNQLLRFVSQKQLRFGIYCVLLVVGSRYLICGQSASSTKKSMDSATYDNRIDS